MLLGMIEADLGAAHSEQVKQSIARLFSGNEAGVTKQAPPLMHGGTQTGINSMQFEQHNI